MSGMNKSGQGVDFDDVVDDDEVDVDAQRVVRVGWCRGCSHLEALVQNINGGPESAQEYGMRWLDILLQVGVVRQK